MQIKVIATILYVVLQGCKTWSFTLRQEHRLSAFMNKVLRRIHEFKIKEITGGWRKLQHKQFYNFYLSQTIIQMVKSR